MKILTKVVLLLTTSIIVYLLLILTFGQTEDIKLGYVFILVFAVDILYPRQEKVP